MPNRRHLNQLPLLALLVIGGFAIAQTIDESGRYFPYTGYLEDGGAAVSGARDMQMRLFSAPAAVSACHTQDFPSVVVSAGRFTIVVTEVDDSCLVEGELYAELSVGPAGGTLVDLSGGAGGRMRLGAVPFAAANAKGSSFLTGSEGRISFEDPETGVPVHVTGDDGEGGISVRADSAIPQGETLFRVRSPDGTVRLRVTNGDNSGADPAYIGEDLQVAGDVDVGTNKLLLTDADGSVYELTGEDDVYDESGVELRALTNPLDNAPLFTVMSSGGAERLRVEHNGTNYMENNLDVSGHYLEGGVRMVNTDVSGGIGCSRVGLIQTCWGRTAYDSGTQNQNLTFTHAFNNSDYALSGSPGPTGNNARMFVIRTKSTAGASITVYNDGGSKSGVEADWIAVGVASTAW